MAKKRYDDEKVIFGYGEATTSFANPNRMALLFYKRELELLGCRSKRLKVLDVGCGAGNKTKTFKHFFPKIQIWGCDVSKNAIREAKIDSTSIRFFVASAESLPLESNRFDIVIMNSVLDHTKNPQKSAREAFRVLKKEGVFLFMDPLEAELTTIHGLLTRFKFFRNHRKNRCGHNHAFTKKSLTELVEKAGFRVERIVLTWFYFAQFVDVIYYPLLALSGKGPEFTLKRFSRKRQSFFAKVIWNLRATFTILVNLESTLTGFIPLGFLAYVKAKKR